MASDTVLSNKLADSAVGTALAAAVEGSAALDTFVDFTSGLVHSVIDTITDSTIEQLKAYAELVSAVSGSLADYQAKTIGDSAVAADKFITEVVGPQFAANPANVQSFAADPFAIDPAKLADFKAFFAGVTAGIEPNLKAIGDADIIGVNNDPNAISHANLLAFCKARLEREVKKSYEMLLTILKLGMQKVVITEGEIHTKLTFHVSAAQSDETSASQTLTKANNSSSSFVGKLSAGAGFGGFGASASGKITKTKTSSTIKVNVANEKHTSQTSLDFDILGEVKLKFKTDYFPSFTPPPPPAAPPAP
jgi:hypothetical protein